MRKTIWLLQTGEPLPLDPGARLMRTGLLARLLAARGHAVRWFVSSFEHQRKIMRFPADTELTLPDGVVLQVIKSPGYASNMSLARYRDHALVARTFRRIAPGLPRPDVVVASLPCHNLAYEGVAFAAARGIPSMVDIRDPWPDIIIDYLPAPLRPLARLALWGDLRRARRLFQQTDAIVAVSRTFLDWGLAKAGRAATDRDQTLYLGYPRRRHPEDAPVPSWLAGLEGRRLAVFVGTFGRSYELELVARAARIFHEAGERDVAFVVAGDGGQADALRAMAGKCDNLLLPGWLDRDTIAALLVRASVGLAPCRMAPGTVSNKIFEYAAHGLPVIASLRGEMETLLARHGFGLSYAPGDVDGLVAALRTVLGDPERRRAMGAAAAAFHAAEGDSGAILERYADRIEQLAARQGIPRR